MVRNQQAFGTKNREKHIAKMSGNIVIEKSYSDGDTTREENAVAQQLIQVG